MADEIETTELEPIETTAPAPDTSEVKLDDIISKALDGADSAEEPSSDRARDEKGRFAPKSEAESAPQEGTSDKPAVVSTEQPTEAQAEPVSEGHFRGWSPEEKAAFQKLPAEAQKLALDVVGRRDAYYGERLTKWHEFGEATAPLVNAVRPHIDHIRQKTDDPAAYVKAVLDVDYRLQYAPYHEKVQLLSQLANQIGVPFATPQADPLADPVRPGGEAYPLIHDLRTELASLKSQLGTFQQQRSNFESQQVSSQIASFAAAKNADGSPKYPHYERVKGYMGQLMQSGQASTLEDAYTAAVKPINDLVASELAARQKAADEAQKAAIAKAKRALPVRTSGIAPGGRTKSAGLDAMISSALDGAGIQ